MIGLKKKQKKKKEAAAAAAAAAAAEGGSSGGGASKGEEAHGASKKAKISITGQQRGREKIAGASGSKRPPAVVLRLQKDISELDGGDTAAVTFPDPSNLKIMNVSIAKSSQPASLRMWCQFVGFQWSHITGSVCIPLSCVSASGSRNSSFDPCARSVFVAP